MSDTKRLTGPEIDAIFARWKARREARTAELSALLRAHLRKGGLVREWYRTDGHTDWRWQPGPEPSLDNDVDKLADHLLARHRGFGLVLELVGAGVRTDKGWYEREGD